MIFDRIDLFDAKGQLLGACCRQQGPITIPVIADGVVHYSVLRVYGLRVPVDFNITCRELEKGGALILPVPEHIYFQCLN